MGEERTSQIPLFVATVELLGDSDVRGATPEGFVSHEPSRGAATMSLTAARMGSKDERAATEAFVANDQGTKIHT